MQSEVLESTMNFSCEVLTGGEEALLAGRFSEYEAGIVYTFLCNIQADFLANSSTRTVCPMDLSPSVGALGFR